MKSQPNRTYASNDEVMTPPDLARALVRALAPSGRILEPCLGSGAFAEALAAYGNICTCDVIHDGSMGFSWWSSKVDWVLTNPPWSNFRLFLCHGMTVADHVALLATVNHWWTKRRVAEVRQAGFGYRRLLLCEWPKAWPSSGFQLGMMVVSRGYDGPLHIDNLEGWKP